MSKLLFFDVDGTLFRSGVGMPQSTASAIKAAVKAGHRLFICTGRGASTIPAEVKNLPFEGGIFSCGTYVEMDGKTLNNACVEGDICQHIFRTLREYDCPFFVENPDYFYYDPEFLPDGFDGLIGRMKASYPGKSRELSDDLKTIAKMTGYPRNRDVIPKIIQKLSPWFEVIVHDEYDYIEITLKGYTKGSGVQLIIDALGFSREDTYGFGDSGNDTPMLETVGTAVVLGDAPDYLKERFIATERLKEDGLAKAMDRLGLTEIPH